jgi:hypothetical protein
VDIEDAYLTLYSGQDYATAIARILRIADPFARFATEETGHTLSCKLVWMDGERDWIWEASQIAQAIGMRLKKDRDVWVLFPSSPSGSWEIHH